MLRPIESAETPVSFVQWRQRGGEAHSSIRGGTIYGESSRDISTLDVMTATSRLVALTREGSVDPEVTLAILLELRAELFVLRQFLESRQAAAVQSSA